MDAFGLQRHGVADYADYTRSFVRIADERLRRRVEEEMAAGLLWPEPLRQLNPAFEPLPFHTSGCCAARYDYRNQALNHADRVIQKRNSSPVIANANPTVARGVTRRRQLPEEPRNNTNTCSQVFRRGSPS